MIQGFRKLFQSPLGLALTLGFVALIALAFASADITGSGFGGIAGSERVATVGDQKITTSQLRTTVGSAFEQARENNPTATMEDFLEAGAIDNLLDQMIERYALYDFGLSKGMRIGDSLIGSELTQMAAFQGPDGKFSQDLYNQAIQRRGLSDQMVREDIGQGLVSRMLLVPTTYGDKAPLNVARRYAGLLNETRHGGVALIPSPAFIDQEPVDDAVLKKYLADNRDTYMLPERRTIRLATFGAEVLGDAAKPTEAEIAERSKANASQYAAREEREFEQLIVPTEAAANALKGQIASPSQLRAVAEKQGLETNTVTATSRQQLASTSTPQVAAAVYDAASGSIVGPVRGPLGFYLIRVGKVTPVAARGIDAVRGEIAEAIGQEKTRSLMADRASQIEDRLQSGASLADVAKSLNAKVTTTPPLTEDGSVFGEGEVDPSEARLAQTVFAMQPGGDAQIAASMDGQRYVIFEPGEVTRAAPPPFDDIKDVLTRNYKLEQGSEKAKAAADKVMAAIKGGKTLSEALAALDVRTPPVDSIDLSRRQLMAQRQQRGIAPPLALMFTMAPKTAKRLEAPNGLGWFIVSLDSIDVPELADDDPIIAQTQAELSRLRQQELIDQLRVAIAKEVPVTRNDNAIAAVRTQLAPQRN
jgi:peptidyl-prolyl cis-trans isomerase D